MLRPWDILLVFGDNLEQICEGIEREEEEENCRHDGKS